MRAAKKNRQGVKKVQWFSTAEKLQKRRVKRKSGPAALRRVAKRKEAREIATALKVAVQDLDELSAELNSDPV